MLAVKGREAELGGMDYVIFVDSGRTSWELLLWCNRPLNGSMLPVHVTTALFQQKVNIRFFYERERSAVGTVVSLSMVDVDVSHV
jgi:hypothetical protein